MVTMMILWSAPAPVAPMIWSTSPDQDQDMSRHRRELFTLLINHFTLSCCLQHRIVKSQVSVSVSVCVMPSVACREKGVVS